MSGTDADPDVLVLRRGAHGMSSERYAEELRDRLPDHEVVRARTPAEERELITNVPVATGHRLPAGLIEHAEDLRLFACAAAGVGHLPLEELEERGVAVTNASGVHGPNIAEQVVGSILVFSRNLHEGIRRGERAEWRHYQAHHTELGDSTVTVVGLGAIGEAIVERLRPFGPRVLGVRYSPEKGGPTDEVFGFGEESFHEALAETDYLVLACPLTGTTRGLVDAEAFDTLSPEAVLVNVGRGPIVETDALLDAVRGNAIRGAALDVTDPEPLPADHELWGMGNVIVTPHNAGHTAEYYPRLAGIVAENVRRIEGTGSDADLRKRVR
jgi:phosphoglycerate dehydrogenase-like enzyme